MLFVLSETFCFAKCEMLRLAQREISRFAQCEIFAFGECKTKKSPQGLFLVEAPPFIHFPLRRFSLSLLLFLHLCSFANGQPLFDELQPLFEAG